MGIGGSKKEKLLVKNIERAVSLKGMPAKNIKPCKYGTSTDEVVEYTVYRTYDYDKFKKMKGNRKVEEKRVNTIIESVHSIGRLPTPIVVNENMEVVEGQGRLEAFRRLGLPIEYIIQIGATVNDCRVINQANTPWGEEDYIDSQIESDNINYIRAKALHGLGFTYLGIFDFAYNYLQCGCVKKIVYTKGTFQLPEDTYNFIKYNAATILSFDDFAAIVGVRREQVQAIIYWLMRHKDIDIKHLKKNISMLETIILKSRRGKTTRSYPRAINQNAAQSVENLFTFIVDVYNDGLSAKNQLDSSALYDEVMNSRVRATYKN